MGINKTKKIKQTKSVVVKSSSKKLVKTLKKPKCSEEAEELVEVPGTLKLEIDERIEIKPKTIEKAIKALIKAQATDTKTQKQLFNETIPILLQINAIKFSNIPSKIARIPVKHSLYNDNSEICLIVADLKGVKRKDHEKNLQRYEELLKKHDIKRNIKKILTFHELKTEYETYELMRRLVNLYDVFLVDGRISGRVVRKCGKIFYRKHKIPSPIHLNSMKLKEHIDQVLNKVPLYLHAKGDSFSIPIGDSNIDMDWLVENACCVLNGLTKHFPGGLENIRNVNVHMPNGLSLPIYSTLKIQNDVSVGLPKA